MKPVIVEEGTSPIILGMPHVGQHLPNDIKARLNPLGLRIDDTDWWIDDLYKGLLTSPTVVKATFSRYVIDANRDPNPNNESLYPGQNTTGVCSPTTFDNKSIYLGGYIPNEVEISERLASFHTPYHAAMAAQIKRVKEKHGVAVLYDCHSIRSNIPYLFGGELPIFNIGTNDGLTCHPLVEAAVVGICKGVSEYPYALNGRFKGGWTTRHYGNPKGGVHVIQMELGQRAYMNEAPPWDYRPDLAKKLQPYLKALLLKLETLALEGSLNP
jgi:N-formylglutamate deformylase